MLLPSLGGWVLYIFTLDQYTDYNANINIYYIIQNNLENQIYLTGFTLWDEVGYGYLHVMQG